MQQQQLDLFKVHIQGGALELLIPIPDPKQSIAWLKEEFRSRAEKRGKSLMVDELSFNGYLVDDVDSICDVLSDECRLIAIGPGIEPPPTRSSGPDESGRTKRKYTRGGHKKLKVVAHVLEAHLPEMMQTAEKERQRFYAKMVALPQMMAADVNRDEIVSWYKRARKKSRGGDDDENDDDRSMSNGQQYYSQNNGSLLNHHQNNGQNGGQNGQGQNGHHNDVMNDWKMDHNQLMNPTNLEYNPMEVYTSLDSQPMLTSTSSSSQHLHHQTSSDSVSNVDYSSVSSTNNYDSVTNGYDYVSNVDYSVVNEFTPNNMNTNIGNNNSQHLMPSSSSTLSSTSSSTLDGNQVPYNHQMIYQPNNQQIPSSSSSSLPMQQNNNNNNSNVYHSLDPHDYSSSSLLDPSPLPYASNLGYQPPPPPSSTSSSSSDYQSHSALEYHAPYQSNANGSLDLPGGGEGVVSNQVQCDPNDEGINFHSNPLDYQNNIPSQSQPSSSSSSPSSYAISSEYLLPSSSTLDYQAQSNLESPYQYQPQPTTNQINTHLSTSSDSNLGDQNNSYLPNPLQQQQQADFSSNQMNPSNGMDSVYDVSTYQSSNSNSMNEFSYQPQPQQYMTSTPTTLTSSNISSTHVINDSSLDMNVNFDSSSASSLQQHQDMTSSTPQTNIEYQDQSPSDLSPLINQHEEIGQNGVFSMNPQVVTTQKTSTHNHSHIDSSLDPHLAQESNTPYPTAPPPPMTTQSSIQNQETDKSHVPDSSQPLQPLIHQEMSSPNHKGLLDDRIQATSVNDIMNDPSPPPSFSNAVIGQTIPDDQSMNLNPLSYDSSINVPHQSSVDSVILPLEASQQDGLQVVQQPHEGSAIQQQQQQQHEEQEGSSLQSKNQTESASSLSSQEPPIESQCSQLESYLQHRHDILHPNANECTNESPPSKPSSLGSTNNSDQNNTVTDESPASSSSISQFAPMPVMATSGSQSSVGSEQLELLVQVAEEMGTQSGNAITSQE